MPPGEEVPLSLLGTSHQAQRSTLDTLLSCSQNQVDTSAQGETNNSPDPDNPLNSVSHIRVRNPMPGASKRSTDGRLEPLVDAMPSQILSNKIS